MGMIHGTVMSFTEMFLGRRILIISCNGNLNGRIGKGINQAGGRFCRDVEPFCRTAVPIVMEHSGNKKQPAGRQAV